MGVENFACDQTKQAFLIRKALFPQEVLLLAVQLPLPPVHLRLLLATACPTLLFDRRHPSSTTSKNAPILAHSLRSAIYCLPCLIDMWQHSRLAGQISKVIAIEMTMQGEKDDLDPIAWPLSRLGLSSMENMRGGSQTGS